MVFSGTYLSGKKEQRPSPKVASQSVLTLCCYDSLQF